MRSSLELNLLRFEYGGCIPGLTLPNIYYACLVCESYPKQKYNPITRWRKPMDQKKIAKQMIQFNKTAFDNGYNAMTMMYEQNEKMMVTFLTQAPGLNEEAKKAFKDWMAAYRTGCNDFKILVDENYAKAEGYFNTESEPTSPN